MAVYTGGCGGGGGDQAVGICGGGGGGGASFYNNSDTFGYQSALPTITYISSATATQSDPDVTLTLTGDTQVPVVSIASPARGSRWGAVPVFSGTAEQGQLDATSVNVPIKQPDGTVVQTLSAPVAAAGTWEVTASSPLPTGSYTAVVTQTLVGGGNPGTASSAFTVDATAPQITLAVPTDGTYTNSTALAVSGTAGSAPGDLGTATVLA